MMVTKIDRVFICCSDFKPIIFPVLSNPNTTILLWQGSYIWQPDSFRRNKILSHYPESNQNSSVNLICPKPLISFFVGPD